MNKEEKEVVRMIKTGLGVSVEGQIIEKIHLNRKEAQTLLNLIQKQEKIIDKMAEKLVEDTEWFYSEFDNYTKQDFIEYFKKEVEKEC